MANRVTSRPSQRPLPRPSVPRTSSSAAPWLLASELPSSGPADCAVRDVALPSWAHDPQTAARWLVGLGAVTFESSRGRVLPRFHEPPLGALGGAIPFRLRLV